MMYHPLYNQGNYFSIAHTENHCLKRRRANDESNYFAIPAERNNVMEEDVNIGPPPTKRKMTESISSQIDATIQCPIQPETIVNVLQSKPERKYSIDDDLSSSGSSEMSPTDPQTKAILHRLVFGCNTNHDYIQNPVDARIENIIRSSRLNGPNFGMSGGAQNITFSQDDFFLNSSTMPSLPPPRRRSLSFDNLDVEMMS